MATINLGNYDYECTEKYTYGRLHPDMLFAKKYFLKDYSWSSRCDLARPLKILHMYTKNKFQILLYNIILFIRFYIRRLLKYAKNK